MRLRALRFSAATLLAAPLFFSAATADDDLNRQRPAVLVPFRSRALGSDVKLRDAGQPAAKQSLADSASKGEVKRQPESAKPASLVAFFSKSAPELRRAEPPAVTRIIPPLPAPRSPLSPRNDPPASALPPGGRDLALQPTTFTPYDRYLGTVRSVIANLVSHDATMVEVARLMKEGHRFRYCVSDPYRPDPPSVTDARHAGDCKSKALWLLDNIGDGNALFVIGKAEKRARTSHAWVYWRWQERWWILDCTERTDPIAADSVSSDRYVPYYSFGRGGAYRHKATRLILTGAVSPSMPVVADRR
jgi:hypothetical protein